ncbi:MAG: hypothetical protein WAO71_06905 [Gallionella sp.]
MEIQEAYKHKMAAQLHEWNAEISLLDAKVENASVDMEIKRAQALHELRAKQHTASVKLQELEKSSGAAWEQVKETADLIWEDLKSGIADARAKFK